MYVIMIATIVEHNTAQNILTIFPHIFQTIITAEMVSIVVVMYFYMALLSAWAPSIGSMYYHLVSGIQNSCST